MLDADGRSKIARLTVNNGMEAEWWCDARVEPSEPVIKAELIRFARIKGMLRK